MLNKISSPASNMVCGRGGLRSVEKLQLSRKLKNLKEKGNKMKKNLFGKNMILAALLVAAFAIAPAMVEAKGAKEAPKAAAMHQPENRGPGHGPQGPGHHGPRGPQPGFHHHPAPAPMPPHHHHHVAPRPAPMPPRVIPVPAPVIVAPVPPPPPPPPVQPAPIGYQWELNGGNWVLVRLGPIVIDLNW